MPKSYPKFKKGAYKRRQVSSVKRAVYVKKPKEYFSTRAKIFPSLASNMGLRMTFTSDPIWDIQNAGGTTSAGVARTCYMYLDLLNMDAHTNRASTGVNEAFWHNTQHLAMLQAYEEFLYQTTYIGMDLYMDSVQLEQTRPVTRQVQVAARLLPLSSLKKPDVVAPSGMTSLLSSDVGTLFTGIDYYGMMTGMPGVKQTILTDDGNRGGQHLNFKVDAFEHNGSPIKGTSYAKNTTDTGPVPAIAATRASLYASADYSALSGYDRQVLLIAFRYFAGDDINTFKVRANLKMDQHWIYSDLRIGAQDLLYNPAIQVPDGR